MERAAELLQAAFRANGIDLEAKRESEAKAGLPAFYLGASKLAAANGIDPKALSRLSYVHKAVGLNVIIVGDNKADTRRVNAGVQGVFAAI